APHGIVDVPASARPQLGALGDPADVSFIRSLRERRDPTGAHSQELIGTGGSGSGLPCGPVLAKILVRAGLSQPPTWNCGRSARVEIGTRDGCVRFCWAH